MSTDRWMDTKDVICVCVYVCVYVMEYYSGIKKNEVMPFVATRMGLEITLLSEISQKDKHHVISLLCGI